MFESYEFKKDPNIIGYGSFSNVYVGRRKKDDTPVAVKMIKNLLIELNEMTQQYEQEIENHKLIGHHENIVTFYDNFSYKTYNYIILEFVDGGDLFDVRFNAYNIDEFDIKCWTLDIVNGLKYIHKLGIIHRDIKLENLLLDKTNNRIKICDFGWSVYTEFPDKCIQIDTCGTCCYMSPEEIVKCPYNKSVDIWSLGVVIYILMAKQYPFGDDEYTDKMYKRIKTLDYEKLPETISKNGKDLVSRILTYCENRPTLEEIVKHKWFYD